MTLTLKQNPELLPCPFCGSRMIDPEGWTSLEEYKGTKEYRSGPACDDCGASAQSIRIWNSRETESELQRYHADMLDLTVALDQMLEIYWGVGDGQLPEPQCIKQAKAALRKARTAR